MGKHTVQEKSEFYVLCLKKANTGETLYWGSKRGFACFSEDLSQATRENRSHDAQSHP